MNGLKALQDMVSMSAYGMTKEQAHEQGICIDCKKPVRDASGEFNKEMFPTEPAEKEYRISGLCDPCFDKIFEEGNFAEMGMKKGEML